MKYARLIVTESGECVSVTHLVQGETEAAVIQRATAILRATIDTVVREHPRAMPSPEELEAAQQHGTWWADLGSETFTVMITEPEQIECPDTTQVEVDVQGGRVSQVRAPAGTVWNCARKRGSPALLVKTDR